ncbi:hypothetical protein A3K73_04675 [Candidatus Pacearchaeota archaeon RBG_13_36_9]|nr:MAG: hypothetical protein A3K73_04675 [Candidatus Pacearchaeota archaeon RBG_13_36_9]
MVEGTKAVSRRLFLGLAGVVLAGCAVPQARVETPGFEAGAYNYLTDEFIIRGLHNLGSPLFDFNDREVREAYERASAQRGLIYDKDFDGAGKIEFEVERHLYLHGNKTLILLSGAAFHIYGAVRTLEKLNTGYISITPRKIKFGDVLESNKIFKYPAESELGKAREMLEIQMRRANGISAEMGYGNLFGFVEKVSSDKKEAGNIAVGIEETGLHNLYTSEYTGRVYSAFGDFLERFHPRSILFLRENMFFYEDKGREDFFKKAKKLGISVEISGF